jgi:hypothetical protein
MSRVVKRWLGVYSELVVVVVVGEVEDGDCAWWVEMP